MARTIQGVKFTKSSKRKRDAKLKRRREKSLVKGYPKRTVWY